MSINQRIRQIRKDCGLNQTEFATKIGVTQSGVSFMERNGSAVSDQTIKAICMAFNINESWLRNGTEPMHLADTTVSLDKFVKDHGGTDLELDIMKAYFSLPKDVRETVMSYFQQVFSKNDPEMVSLDKLHDELDRQYTAEKTAEEKSEVS